MAIKKGADQTVQMHMLVCAFVVHMQQSQVSRIEALNAFVYQAVYA